MKQNLLFNRASALGMRFIMVLTMLLIVGIGQAWAATWEKATSIAVGDVVVLVYESDSTKKELGGISTTSTKYGTGVDYTTTPAGQYELTVEAGSNTGTYSFKNSSGSYLYWNSGNSLNVNVTKNTNTSWTVTFDSDNAVIKNVKDATRQIYWNTSSPRFACYTSAQASVQLYKKAASYTITATSNNDSYGTVTVSGTTITATPNAGYRVKSGDAGYTVTNGTAVVINNGDDTFTVTPSSNCTITINFEAIPKYTVTLVPGSGSVTNTELEEPNAGEGVILPTPTLTGCDEWSFAGWKTTSAVTTETTTEPTLIPAGAYSPTSDITLYAVYQRTEGGGGGGEASLTKMVAGNTLSDGDKIVVVANETYTAMYQETINSSYVNKWDCSTLTADVVADDDKNWWTVTMTDGGFYLGDDTNGYLNMSSNNLYCNTSKSVWTLLDLEDGTFKLQSNERNLSYRSDLTTNPYWRMGGTSYGTAGQTILNLYKYTSGGNTTTYYYSNPDCATQTLVTLSQQGGTGGTTSVIATKGEAMPTITPPTRTGYTFNGYYDAQSGGTQYYNADGTSAKAWDKDDKTFTLYAQWTCETPAFDIKIKDDNPVVFSGESIELTVVGSNIATDATYQWYKKNGESYDELTGQITDNTLIIANATANDAGNYKCVVTNGTCSGENNYTVKMYHIKGLTDNAWTTPFEFEKSGDKEGAFSVNLAANITYEFKLNDGSVWYWNEGTMTHNNCTDWVIEQEGDDTQGKANTKITTTASGTYIFTLNYTDPSKPKLSVTYPQKKMVYLNPGNWNSPNYAVYSWDGDNNSTVLMTKIDDCADRNIYQAEIDASHSNVIFIGGNASYNVANPWNNISYQTIDLTYPSDDNVLYEINTTHLFLKPNKNWREANARFAAYFFGDGETWASMTIVTDSLYKVTIPTNKNYPSVIFCRMNPSAAANNWNNKWNQSADLTITKGKNHYTIEEEAWDPGGGTWKTAGDWTAFTPNYTVTFNANGHGTAPEDQCITDGGTATNPGNLSATGYTFGGWYKDADCTNAWDFANDVVTSDITLYAKWTANTNTAYRVLHYQQNILDDNYTLYATENLTGTTATSVTPAVKDYIGFTAPSTQTVTIAADGSTVVEYKYTRNSYTLTWDLAGGEITEAGTTAGSVKFDAPLTAPTVTKSGLTFIGWSPEVPATMPAADATYTAIWENCIWVETTTIEDDDEIVFIMVDNTTSTSYAMNNEVVTSSNPLAIEINTDIFSSGNVPNNIIWDIQKDANGIVFYSKTAADNYLRCNAKPNVRVGVGANNTFTLDNGYIQSLSYDDSYLAVATGANIKDWRQYAHSSNNIANQTLKFYKRVCLQEGQYWVKWMVNGQEYTEGNPTTMVTDGQITAIPDNPENDAIGDCADTFMGWSESNLGSAEGQPAPTDLFTTVDEAQSKIGGITENKTFYAVFATAEAGQSSTESIFSEDFSSISKGDNTTTGGSGDSWDKNDNFYSVSNVFQAGGAVRLGKSNEVGYLVTKQLTAAIGETLTISFTVKGWSSVEGNIQVSGNNSEFTQPSAISYTSTMSDSFETKSVSVVLTKANPYIKIATTGKRAFIDDIQITKTTSPAPTYSNYVTNCCTLAPATNLTVSGTTSNTATLTWTAPSSTTGITKLQVRNAETDFVVVDNIDVNTTTATITELKECISYQYYVVSVGECEVVSNTVTATPFSGAKTVNYDYNGGTGSPASFTTNCTNQTITLPVATRTGWTFNGWYTAATGGTRVGGANDTYEPATSPVTLYAQWTINQYTVTWNLNGGNWNGSTANIVETYEYGATINRPADPTRENGIFKGWNPTPATTMPASNKTYTAQWDMVYTLTFVDMNTGGTTRTQTQQSSGESIVAPTADSEVCDMWTFIGWAPSNSLNGGTDKPTGFIVAGETIPGSQITDNDTYYSVYSYNSDNTQEFEVGKSGTYLMYALSGSTKYYATTARTGGFYGNPETSFATYGPSKFTLTYNKTENKYIIYHENTTSGRESSGYFELNTSNGVVDVESESPSLFTIQEGSSGSFIIRTDYSSDPRSFGYDGNFKDYSDDNPVYFEPASEIQYYNAANCGEVKTYTMSFHNPFGDENALIWYDAEHEESYYTDKPLNTSIEVFPTMVYNGWAFIGWTANQQYNELIGEDNLDDENSATNDPASALTIYSNTAGWSYQLNSNVTMYPVFTKYEDNEDIDLGSGGEYYMYFYREDDYYKDDYFGSDNHYQRMYALAGGGDNGEFGYTTNCNNAQIFEFIKEGDGWNIRVKNADGSYPTKSYLVNTSGNDYDLVAAKPSSTWSITKEAEGDFTMWYRGNASNSESNIYYQAKACEYSGGTSWDFKCYNQDNDASQYYYKVYLGTCENRVFSSNPTNKPAITLSGEPIVTSTQDQSIRAQGELIISATKLAANGTITLTSDNADVYFSTVKDANFTQATKPVASLPLYADEKGKLAMTTVYVHYKPTSTSSLGVQTANITATTGTNGQPDYATATTTAALRNLPAKFVIATKVGATWYALPADLTTASNPLGVVIEVDETNMTATAPNSCTYTLFPVKTTNTEYDRYEEYGDRLRFSAVNNSYKGLWANNSKTDLTINNDMVIDQASDGQTGSDLANNSYYEWKVTTTVVDGHWQYTLQTDQTQNQNYLRYWTSAEGTPVGPKWGTYNAGENKLYFLPVTETQPFEYDVVEWYPTKMLIQTDAAITSPTVKVRGEEVASPELTSKGGTLYEISNLPLETNPNKLLQVSFTADAVEYANAKVVPIILSREAKSITGEPFATLTQKEYQYADVVVRDGATLTIDGGTDVANTLLGMTIYPTAKVAVAEGYKLSVHNLTFFGGIDEIYDGSTYEINKYGVPQLSLKGILNKTITNIDYIMRVNLDQMYQVGVPYDVNLSDITYWDGTTMTLGDNLYVSAYDGQKRANREEKSWVWETDFTEKVLKAGIGYTISADKQDAAHEYSIIRMPMKNNIMSGNTETAKTVQVYAYDNKNGVEITDNHKGWNYLSNPYMVAISGAEADSKLVVGYLRETGTGPWEWVDDNYRYVTIPSDDGKWYDQQQFEKATLLPFKSFFLQIATSGELSFALASRQSAPARYLQSSNEQREVEFEVLLANDTRSDNLGFLIGEDYTPAYEINADLEKMIGSMSVYTIYNGYNLAYNALSPTNAAEQIPIGYVVPTVGEYTFALDESSDIEDVEHIYLIDYETSAITDLVTDVYTFTTLEQKSDTRFAINVALKSKDNTATGLDNMNTNGEHTTKFIYQDKMYILHHGVIYDATGKRVITINK